MDELNEMNVNAMETADIENFDSQMPAEQGKSFDLTSGLIGGAVVGLATVAVVGAVKGIKKLKTKIKEKIALAEKQEAEKNQNQQNAINVQANDVSETNE